MDWYAYEKQAMSQGCRAVCGIDEAGRGPLAGPVCAAAVILPVDCELPGLDDSKKLTEKKRELLFPLITQKALAYGIGWANAEEIDRLNILQATFDNGFPWDGQGRHTVAIHHSPVRREF